MSFKSKITPRGSFRRRDRSNSGSISTPVLQTSPVLWSVDAGSDASSLYVGKDRCVVGTKDGSGKNHFDLHRLFALFFATGGISMKTPNSAK